MPLARGPDTADGPLGEIYTLAEAAEYLRTTKSAVARIARRTGHCSMFGSRVMRFSESDLLALWDACRVTTTMQRKRLPAGLSEEETHRRALELLAKPKRSRPRE
jgi:hypothetical protein